MSRSPQSHLTGLPVLFLWRDRAAVGLNPLQNKNKDFPGPVAWVTLLHSRSPARRLPLRNGRSELANGVSDAAETSGPVPKSEALDGGLECLGPYAVRNLIQEKDRRSVFVPTLPVINS